MQQFRFILDVALTVIVLLSGIMVLLFGLGLYVTEIEVGCNIWVSSAFVITSIAALDRSIGAERVLKGILILTLLAVAGYLYLDYILDDLFPREPTEIEMPDVTYYDIHIAADPEEALCRWHIE